MTLTVRDAQPSDYDVYARLFAEFGVPDPVPTEKRFGRSIAPSTLLALWEHERAGLGYWLKLGDVASVVQVIVDPAFRGRGVGRRLMDEISTRARASGCSRWMLNVKRDNAVAIRLYERCGMHVAFESDAMRIAWRDVSRLPESGQVDVVTPGPDDDGAVELELGLVGGETRVHRARPNRVLLALRSGGRFAGFASFDPTFPGAMPFRVKRPGLARALFEAMRPHALAEHDHVRFVAEGDAALVEIAHRAGAITLLEMYRMEGAIPGSLAPG